MTAKIRSGAEIYFKNRPVFSVQEEYKGKLVYAKWKARQRQIWIFFNSWKKEFQNPEFLMWIINHEFLHSVIDDILDTDGIYDETYHDFPFVVGIDEMFGVSQFETHVLPKIMEKGYYLATFPGGTKHWFGVDFANKILRLKNGASWRQFYPNSSKEVMA